MITDDALAAYRLEEAELLDIKRMAAEMYTKLDFVRVLMHNKWSETPSLGDKFMVKTWLASQKQSSPLYNGLSYTRIIGAFARQSRIDWTVQFSNNLFCVTVEPNKVGALAVALDRIIKRDIEIPNAECCVESIRTSVPAAVQFINESYR